MTSETDIATAMRVHGLTLPAFDGPDGTPVVVVHRCPGCDAEVPRNAPMGLCAECLRIEVDSERDKRLARVLPELHRTACLDGDLSAWCHDTAAIRWTRAIAERAPACATVTFWGTTGGGKSTLAAALMRALISGQRRHASMAWFDARDLSMARRNHKLGQGDPPEIEKAIEADIAVIDELGKETTARGGDPADVVMVLDERHRRRAGRLTIVTTEWAARDDAKGEKLSGLYMPSLVRRLTEPWRPGPPPVGAAIVIHVRRQDEMSAP